MTQLLGFATGFLLSVGVVVYVTGETPWRDTLCNIVPGCESTAATGTPVAPPTAAPAAAESVKTVAKKTSAATAGEPPAEKNLKPMHRPESIVAQEKALVTVPTPPAPKTWDAGLAATPATVLAAPLTSPEPAQQTTAPSPPPQPGAGQTDSGQHVFWPPFNNAVSASGFAELITEKTGLPVAVVKEKPGRYAVAIAYRDSPQLQQHLDLIELAVGLKPLQGRRL